MRKVEEDLNIEDGRDQDEPGEPVESLTEDTESLTPEESEINRLTSERDEYYDFIATQAS